MPLEKNLPWSSREWLGTNYYNAFMTQNSMLTAPWANDDSLPHFHTWLLNTWWLQTKVSLAREAHFAMTETQSSCWFLNRKHWAPKQVENGFSPPLSHQRLLLFACDAIQLHHNKSLVKTHTMPYTLTLSLQVIMQRHRKKRCDEQCVMIKPLHCQHPPPPPPLQVLFKLKPSVNKYES